MPSKLLKSKEDKSLINLIYTMVILALLLMNIVTFIKHHPVKYEETQKVENTAATNVVVGIVDDNTIEQSMQNVIGRMGERDRCETYVGEFFIWMEKGDYNRAYNCLNSTFKQTYFPTIDSFKDYATNKYPKSSGLTYTDIERHSPYYVLYVTVDDLISNTPTFTQRFVLKENGNNDFEISFQMD